MNVKGSSEKKFNKKLSLAMIPKSMPGTTSTKSDVCDNILLNPINNVFVKSEEEEEEEAEEMCISSNKTGQSNTYKSKDISDSMVQSTVDQIGVCNSSILYENNISNSETRDMKHDLELHQSNVDSHKVSNKELIASTEAAHSVSQKEIKNGVKCGNSIMIPPGQPRKRGRPRKYVCIQTPDECDNYVSQQQISNSETSTYCRQNSSNTSSLTESNNQLSNDHLRGEISTKVDICEKMNTPRRRGRPPSKVKNNNAKKESMKSQTENEEIQIRKCMRCGIEIAEGQWETHNLMKHNNMGWYEGEQPMDFENDNKLLKRVLSIAIKKRKGQLSCEQCETTTRSVNGFISHIQFCGKSDDEKRALMVSCSVCNNRMRPSSMEIHERLHRDLKYNKRKHLPIELADNEKVKRKAAEKAVSKILQFTELVKEEVQQSKKVDFDSSVLKNIQLPALKKKIPSIWKSLWKKELQSKGITQCRQVACDFTSNSYDDMCKHCSQCNFTPQEKFMCKICKFVSTSKEETMEHVKIKHSEIEDNTDNSPDFKEENTTDDESENDLSFKCEQQYHHNASSSVKERSASLMMFLDDPHALKASWSKFYAPAFKWTMEFEMENYEFQFYDDYLPNPFVLLNNEDAKHYLPPLKVSMATKTITVNSSTNTKHGEEEWRYWKTFEGRISEDLPAFFAGGPVWALAWLPIPVYVHDKTPDQYVAVSTHPQMENNYTVLKADSGPNMIQIWNMGKLTNELKPEISTPTLSYAIVHNSGTIWSLKWCPSGCYQDETLKNDQKGTYRRMGLLAAGCSDGTVYIYSLPFPEELGFSKSESNNLPIYKTDPVLILVVNSIIYESGKQNWQCSAISWTKEREHNTIAAGFTNGYIGLWNLTADSPLLKQKQNNSIVMNSFSHFFAHGNAVTGVTIVPYNGQRFLASVSVDRSYKVWDLENISFPQETFKKGIMFDGVWMLHWPSAVIGFDDALSYRHTNSFLVSLREHGYKSSPILPTNSTTFSVTVSDHANSVAHGTYAGEILSIFPHQLLYTKDIDKILTRKRQLNSYIEVVDFEKPKEQPPKEDLNECKDVGGKKSKPYIYMPAEYDQCKDRFGLIIHNNFPKIYDKLAKGTNQKTLYSDKLTLVPIERYPFTSVNRVCWNPNMWSHLWFAAGYENGLVRFLNFSFMSPKGDMNKLIQEHAEAFLKRINNQSQNNH